MSWRDNGYLRDISDTFWTFIGHKVFAGDGFTEIANDTKTGQKGQNGATKGSKGQNDVDGEQDA